MSTITREFTKERLIEHAKYGVERYTKAVAGFPRHIDVAMDLELARIALASLEAEPVAWRSLYYENHGLLTGSKNVLASWQKQGWECEPLYTAPPAPVSVPYLLEQFAEFMAAESIKSGDYPDGWQCKASNAAHEYAQNIRAAMLQGAEPVQGWIPCSERMPGKLIPVMVMYEDGEMWSAIWTGTTWDDGTEVPDPHAVTHWQEMPAAPQQEVK